MGGAFIVETQIGTNMWKYYLRKFARPILRPFRQLITKPNRSSAGAETQVLLAMTYKQMLHHGVQLPKFDQVGFGVYSQNDEDGILLYIFSLIGTTNKKVVDIGCGEIKGSSTANLIIHHGWTGLLMDADGSLIQTARKFYANCPTTRQFPPVLLQTFVTTENINSLIKDHGFSGDIDLLTIDLDGIDFWIWKAIDCLSPRVVMVEYQDILGPDKSLTIPYRPDFKLSDYPVNKLYPNYVGASLPAFVKLARQKGYRLTGCNCYGYNAFFIRSGIGENILPEVSAESCFTHPWNQFGMRERYPRVKDMEWVEI